MIRYFTAGESHGEALIGIVEGMPAGVPVSPEDLNEHTRRRWLGFGRGGRAKLETDRVHIYSGLRFAETMGSPIAIKLENASYYKDKAGWQQIMSVDGEGVALDNIEKITLPRPGHADLVGAQKYHFDDIRPVIDRSSARETAMRVACCSVARQFLKHFGIEIGSHVLRIGEAGYESQNEWEAIRDEVLKNGTAADLYKAADESEVRMLDAKRSAECIEHIKATKKNGDTLGGLYEVVVTGVPVGLGSYVQWDRKLDGQLAQAILSIQAQKAVEIGDGILSSILPGSKIHDEIYKQGNDFLRRTNRAGGIEGGMTNGMPIIVRGYMKPIPTLIKPLETADMVTGESQPTRYERSDVTSVPAASTVAESVVALTIANAFLEKFGGDSFSEIKRRFEAEV